LPIVWQAFVARDAVVCFSVPGSFLLLGGSDEDLVKATLARLKTIWELVLQAETIALTDTWVRNRLKDVVILRWPWVREQFIILSEFEFKHPAREVVEATQKIYCGLPPHFVVGKWLQRAECRH